MIPRSSVALASSVIHNFTSALKYGYTHHRYTGKDGFSGSILTVLGASFGLIASQLAIAEPNPNSNKTRSIPTRSAYKYLICGGGIAAQEALQVFTEQGETDDLLLVTPEWRTTSTRITSKDEYGEIDDSESTAGIFSSISSFISSSFTFSKISQPEIVVGLRVTQLDPKQRIATLDDGSKIQFDRCLLAIGTTIPDVPFGKVVSHNASNLISGAQSESDWKQIDGVFENNKGFRLHNDDDSRPHVTVIGGGWMSTIVGTELIERGANITFSYNEPAFLARYLPKYLSKDIFERLIWESDGGVDSLSYSTIRYIVARKPLDGRGSVEAEVHIGTVFDSFSIIDFRTDHVIFAPTLTTRVPIHAPALLSDSGGFTVNPELAAASDIYVAGSAISVGSGAVNYPELMRWSVDHAKATGRHAALNCLGARNSYSFSPSLTVNLVLLNLKLDIFGNVDGSSESFGYFKRSKERDEHTSGGQIEEGVLFCVTPAPLSHRGAMQKLLITGMALWNGSDVKKIENVKELKNECAELLQKSAMTRPELESVMDSFAERLLKVNAPDIRPHPSASNTNISPEPELPTSTTDEHSSNESEISYSTMKTGHRHVSPRLIWRRHRSARTVRISKDELLWVDDEWKGSVSPVGRADRMSQAYSDLLRQSAGTRTLPFL